MSPTLSGKRAFVTGGSRGIGAAIVKRLAGEGADVAFTFASNAMQAGEVVSIAESNGGRAMAIQADSADPNALTAAIAGATKEFGGLDILVNNAGVATLASIEEFKLEDFDRIVAINLKAVFVATQAAVRHMTNGGRVIMIGSCNADRVPFAGAAVYAMSKAGLVGLVKGLARDLGPRGITVNNIQPGPVDTDMNPASGPFAAMLTGLMALPRYGRDEEIAGMVAYLAGPEAGFVTGASMTIDGGFTA